MHEAQKCLKDLSFNQAFLTFASIVGIIGVGLFKYSINLHCLILGCLIVSIISTLRLGYSYLEIRDAMNDGIREALAAIYIFIMIGVLIAAFIESGTLGTLIYLGIQFIEPSTFLPAGLILCNLMSVVIGSSWATAGTVGVILMGIGTSIGFPAPLVAGMVISGACFGDKMSPVSDTTNLAAMSAGTTLFRHMQSMCYTTIPTYLLALAIFTWFGLDYSNSILPDEELSSLALALDHSFHISLLTILPILVMVILSFIRVPAEVSMMAASMVAVGLALTVQSRPITDVINSLFGGSNIRSGVASLDDLLGRGGILSMMWTLSLSLMALALGGVLNKFGFLRTLIAGILKRIRRKATLVMSTILCCIFGNGAMGEAYMSIILGGQLGRL
ncbi:Na+/H+ antiporter NhaC family protein [Endozoicomonas sp. SCSIO W0465]|uniref:Na+/H+ antiporter NhaC family protein n=1 Tax=Endozoicomonas sp. SCSIO W0465 TaxID=2918516 RepID=UPI0020755326|nr:Na+/H+ antiporter NhaC family protein [Endozoicomonas sp. SCSIO W0465]